jgi:hypothetical protein
MDTRTLKDEPHFLNRIENWLRERENEGKTISCPVCQKPAQWRWADVFQIPIHLGSQHQNSFAVLTCVCGYTLFIQHTPENGLKLPG